MKIILKYSIHFIRRYLLMCIFGGFFAYTFLHANIPILPGANNVQLGGVALAAIVMYWIFDEISEAFWDDSFDEKPAVAPPEPTA